MKPTKLIVNEFQKTYYVLEVSQRAYDNSPSIEVAGFSMGLKIKSDSDLEFRIAELQRLGFQSVE